MKLLTKFGIFCLSVGAAGVMQTARTLHTVETSVIRLHIRADSDTTVDQTAKLLVRDAILADAATWMPQGDYAACCDAIPQHLSALQASAEDALRQAGVDTPVTVSFGEQAFPAKTYGAYTLPAGTYQAVNVTIGSGIGQNWWCVMYPALCLPVASEKPAFDADVEEMLTQPEAYEIRLKCVELLRAVGKKIAAWRDEKAVSMLT